ncbi:MAG: SRPBCC family protein [Bacteroidota bacterium]
MACIILKTTINAPIERCFDLARSIDLHKESTAHTNEQAIAGKTSGLISGGEYVTWRAKHFGIYQHLTTGITSFNPYTSFTDEMTEGPFKYIRHLHLFENDGNATVMTDEFNFGAPFGFLGKFIDKYILIPHLEKLLIKRNQTIKLYAETDLWKNVIT